MRIRVDASVATRAHEDAFALCEENHEPAFQRALERLIRRFARQGAARFEHRDALTAAGELPSWRIPLSNDLIDEAAAQTQLEEKAKAFHDRVATTTSHHVSAALGISFEQSNRLLHGVIASQSGMHISTAPADLVASMMQSLQESYDKGLSIPHAAREMRRTGYTHAKGYAERIARTELIGAVNAASLAQVQGATTIPYKLWMATNDNRTRPTHREADGQTVPVSAAFSVGGHRLEYPGDPSGPGEEVILCRCTLGYVDEPRGLATIAGGRMAATDTTTDTVIAGAAWSGVIAQEGVDTGDGRRIETGALNWRELPLTMMAQHTTPDMGGHAEAAVAGRIDALERQGANIVGGGVFDSGAWGAETERLVREGMLKGISIDLAINEAEIIPDPNAGDEIEALFLGTLNVLDGTILGATIVPFPAFENANIAIVAGAAMHLHDFRREDGRTLASFYMPFAPAPPAEMPPVADDENDPGDAAADAAEAIADIKEVVDSWPGLNGQVVVTIDGQDTTLDFPPATADGSEPGEDNSGAATMTPEVMTAVRRLNDLINRQRDLGGNP